MVKICTLRKFFYHVQTKRSPLIAFRVSFYTMETEPIWKSWFARHGAKLLLFARQQARNPHDAEDLVQEAFVRIWRLYGHTGEVAPGLVYRAVRRLAIDWARSLDRRKIREQKVVAEFPLFESFKSSIEQNERQKAILAAVDRLPPEQKEVLTLKIWGELTFDEIGRTLDLSLNTVASRYRYALQKLRDWIPAQLEDQPKTREKSVE